MQSLRIELPLHLILLDNFHSEQVVTTVYSENSEVQGNSSNKRLKVSMRGMVLNILSSSHRTTLLNSKERCKTVATRSNKSNQNQLFQSQNELAHGKFVCQSEIKPQQNNKVHKNRVQNERKQSVSQLLGLIRNQSSSMQDGTSMTPRTIQRTSINSQFNDCEFRVPFIDESNRE